MDVPNFTVTLDKDQAAILFELIQRDIHSAQKLMKIHPSEREAWRKRIVNSQAIRRQIPECYWR